MVSSNLVRPHRRDGAGACPRYSGRNILTDPNAPDFAMQRAVEILASIYERQRKLLETPPPPMDKPVVLFNESISLAVGNTTRAAVERELGVAFAYPARG